MGFEFPFSSATICLDYLGSIEGNPLKRIDGDEHNATVRVDHVLCISISYSMEHWYLGELLVEGHKDAVIDT